MKPFFNFVMLATIINLTSGTIEEKIPAHIIQALNNIKSTEEFFQLDFVRVSQERSETSSPLVDPVDGIENPNDLIPPDGIDPIPSPWDREENSQPCRGRRCRHKERPGIIGPAGPGSPSGHYSGRPGMRPNVRPNGRPGNRRIRPSSDSNDRARPDPESSQISLSRSSIPPFADCKPRNQSVSAPIPEGTNEMYSPYCVLLPRCGGCCLQGARCLPQKTSVRKFTLRRMAFDSRTNHLVLKAYEEVDFIEHTECRCDCEVKEDDCNSQIHEYKPLECRCKCLNEDDKEKCGVVGKLWDDKTCSCVCPQPTEPRCNETQSFSRETCRCEVSGENQLPTPTLFNNTCAAQSAIDLCMTENCPDRFQPQFIQTSPTDSRCQCRRRRRRRNRRVY